MALIDTGLGWSADDDYLSQLGGALLGKVRETGGGGGGSQFPDQPLPKIADADPYNPTFARTGFPVMTDSPNEYYVESFPSTDAYVFVYGSGSNRYLVYASTYESGVYKAIQVYRYRTNWGDGNYTLTPLSYRPSEDQNFVISEASISSSVVIDSRIPVFETRAEGLAALSGTTTDCYKLNAGYAAACFAKWVNPGGTDTTGFILISSESEYCQTSTDGSTENYDLTGAILIDGMWFHAEALAFDDTATVSSTVLPQLDFTASGPLSFADIIYIISLSRYANIVVTESQDPYGGPTDPGGGDGDDEEPTDIPFSMPPYITASDVGFVQLFNPTQTELRALAAFMWSSGFDLDTLKRVYASPIDYIIGASIVPVIPSLKEASHTITLPGVLGPISTGVSMDVVYQYATVNCGSITVDKKYGAYLDYSPYSRYQLWLPYIGFKDVDADDITGRTIELQYLVDLLSGACNAELLCGSTVLYSWQGQCAAQIPINSSDWSSMFTGAISLAASAVKLGVSVATGGAGVASIAKDVASMGMSAMGMKPTISRGGTVAGAAGFMAAQRPYLVKTRPVAAIPAEQNSLMGYPSFVTKSLGDLTGYNEVFAIHLHNIPATSEELNEIESILKGGVIF